MIGEGVQTFNTPPWGMLSIFNEEGIMTVVKNALLGETDLNGGGL